MRTPEDHARYFIAIVPPSPVYEEALALKNYLKENYQSKAALNSPPHITLHMPFLWKEKKENDLITGLNFFSKGKEPIEIHLHNFGAFAPRVIFVAVDHSEPLHQLQNQLLKFCKTELNLFNAQYKDKPFHPHLTIAFRDLEKPMFAQAWNEFKDKPFAASFPFEKITLLKHDGKLWQPLNGSYF